MTPEVIDQGTRAWLARVMTGTANRIARFDRTLRAVMWLDAFLSVALVVAGVLVSPIVAALGAAPPVRLALGVTAIVAAVLLAAFGAITAVALMLRMRAGDYLLPAGLRVPLPAPMRPDSLRAGLRFRGSRRRRRAGSSR